MTNRDKFKEVFGFKPRSDSKCVFPTNVCNLNKDVCNDCPFDKWWDKEYKECFSIKPEFED